jgi:hypothetical protein
MRAFPHLAFRARMIHTRPVAINHRDGLIFCTPTLPGACPRNRYLLFFAPRFAGIRMDRRAFPSSSNESNEKRDRAARAISL